MDHLHGVTTARSLAEAGVSKGQLMRRSDLERIARGRYALPGARRDFWFDAALALSIAGDDARLTSASALHVLGVGDPPRRIQVVVPEGKGSRKQRGFDVRRSSHLPETTIVLHGLRLTPPTYALTDLARDLRDGGVAHAISTSLGRRLIRLEELQATVDDRGRFPGSARIRRVLDEFGSTESHSKRERTLRRGLIRAGASPHPEPLAIRDASGRVIAEADVPFLELRVDVEVDGPHHLLPAQQTKDRQRDRDLQALDWVVLRYTIHEIDEDLDGVVTDVLDHLERRRRALDGRAA